MSTRLSAKIDSRPTRKLNLSSLVCHRDRKICTYIPSSRLLLPPPASRPAFPLSSVTLLNCLTVDQKGLRGFSKGYRQIIRERFFISSGFPISFEYCIFSAYILLYRDTERGRKGIRNYIALISLQNV